MLRVASAATTGYPVAAVLAPRPSRARSAPALPAAACTATTMVAVAPSLPAVPPSAYSSATSVNAQAARVSTPTTPIRRACLRARATPEDSLGRRVSSVSATAPARTRRAPAVM